MRFSSAPNLPGLLALASLALVLFAGCSREAPDIREVRKATEEYLKALSRRDVKDIAERSTCLTATNSFVGGRVLHVEPGRRVGIAAIDSLVRASFAAQRTADSVWSHADAATADSLFGRARRLSNLANVYRNAARAVPLSSPGAVIGRDSTLETREVRARVRYEGPVIGPRPVDLEELLRLLRVPGGKWVVFSVYPIEEDPKPEMI